MGPGRVWISIAWGLFAAWAAAAGSGAPGAEAEGSAWLAFRSEAERFSVSLPAPPAVRETRHFTFVGTVRSAEFAAWEGATELSVEVHRIPATARWILSEQALLERAARDLVADADGRQARAGPATLDGRSGWQVAYRVDPDRAGLARLALVEDRLYVLAALGPQTGASAPPLARFFDSFRAW